MRFYFRRCHVPGFGRRGCAPGASCIWELGKHVCHLGSAEGWHAAIKITGSWNKLRGETYKTEQQALDDAIETTTHQIADFV